MDNPDVIVVGAGISGLAFAWKAAQEGASVLVLEGRQRVGGCICSHRLPNGFWFEMGAHTVYNSYGAFLDMVVGTGTVPKLIPRGPARARFGLLRQGEYLWLTPPKVLRQLNWLEAAFHFPFGILHSKQRQAVSSYYSRLIGPRNYRRVLSPFFAAVPSQSADGFPVEGPGSLFKKRARRAEFARSFGFHGGLQTVCDAAAAAQGVTISTGVAATGIARTGSGFAVSTSEGPTVEARVAAVALPPELAAPLLRNDFRNVAAQVGRVKTITVESLGVVLPREKCWMPECAFVVPVDDVFFSCVTRDPFPDPNWRGFAFHFRPGLSRDQKIGRISQVLRTEEAQLEGLVEQIYKLPSPTAEHARIVADIQASVAEEDLALTGNYFGGLAIEDCVLRSNAEWMRVSARKSRTAGGP